ncbi:calcium-binding protein [Nostoc sp. FACHB-145]|uniref:calcium-binding protein n=1 Tax=Nostoc sp. FACHB-145 TaxID=2692836 RepID=UPI0016864FDA|nr:calcium-binding protein [Nostoc sp. FACHB-145]MBD2470493.1 calcium-binding protein [Nostoc sp. FACHB-145]
MAYIPGSDQDDILTGTSGNDVIETFAGDDLLNVSIRYQQVVYNGTTYTLPIFEPSDDGGGNDLIQGGIGNDNLSGGIGNDSVDAEGGNDILWGGIGNDTLNGGDGDDIINGHYEYYVYTFEQQEYLDFFIVRDDDPGNDTIDGGSGNDAIYAGNGIDQVNGGAGIDLLDLDTTASTSNFTILYTSSSTGGTISNGTTTRNITNIEQARVTTGSGNDTINFSALASDITIQAGAGNDVITGTNNSNSFFADNLYGGSGNDTINGGDGNDSFYGGDGNDILNGGAGDDTLYGEAGNDTINGGDGNDTIYTGESIDQVNGGAGIDLLNIDTTASTSNFTILYTSSSTGGTISNGTTTRNITNIEQARVTTGSGNDTINFSALASDITIQAGAGNDVITGTNNSNSFFADNLYGGSGNDTINGGAGNDSFYGGDGNDILNGGAGDDTLYGEAGNDRFIFNSPTQGIDTIADFSVVDDTIVVSAAGFGGSLVGGAAIAANRFVIGTAATTASHRFIYSQSTGDLFFDRDGTGAAAQVQIATLSSEQALTNADIFVNA